MPTNPSSTSRAQSAARPWRITSSATAIAKGAIAATSTTLPCQIRNSPKLAIPRCVVPSSTISSRIATIPANAARRVWLTRASTQYHANGTSSPISTGITR